jgi:hypothetical protein
MKTFLICILLLISIKASAPDERALFLSKGETINPYKRIIYAVGKVECSFDTLAYNHIEEATGYFQIRPIRLRDYNERTGSNYKLVDMYNYKISEKVFMYYASQIGWRNPGEIARKWNGKGKNDNYWLKKVKKIYDSKSYLSTR